jgi:hypothetical protein
MKPEMMLDIFHSINHTEIKLSAVFDVLTSQCDRHQQNMFVTKDRKLMIIDNDQVVEDGLDSADCELWEDTFLTQAKLCE